MQKRTFLTVLLCAAVVGISAYVLADNNSPDQPYSTITSGCDQTATTTDCALLEVLYPNPPEPISTELREVVWREYKNDELGFSFQYPTKSTFPLAGGNRNGTTGLSFGISIPLPTGPSIQGYALAKDYSAEKGGVYVGTEGYVRVGDKYSIIRRGEISEISFIPDEILELPNGNQAIVIYQNNFDPSADYPEPTIRAMINLKGDTFTGIGFLMYDSSANPDNVRLFKQIVSSIRVH